MKVLVTGGAGFIGSHLVEDLVGREYEVAVLDDLSTGKMENLETVKDRIEFVRGSVTDLELLKELVKDVNCIFHLAAISSVHLSIENPSLVNEINVGGTLNALIAARDGDVEKVIYASSSAVYGNSETPMKESFILKPLSPYAATKAAGEYYCKVFREIYGLRTVSLRYFNVYGYRQDLHSEYSGVIPKFITRVLKNEPPVIYGSGNQTRDFVFVKDVVKANILAMEKCKEGVFNIGSGKETSINELAEKIIKMLGKDLKPIHVQPRKGEITYSVADISLAEKELGYKPEYKLDEGLRELIEHFRSTRIR